MIFMVFVAGGAGSAFSDFRMWPPRPCLHSEHIAVDTFCAFMFLKCARYFVLSSPIFLSPATLKCRSSKSDHAGMKMLQTNAMKNA